VSEDLQKRVEALEKQVAELMERHAMNTPIDAAIRRQREWRGRELSIEESKAIQAALLKWQNESDYILSSESKEEQQ